MGVDAMMFIKIQPPLAELEVRKISADLYDCYGDFLWITRPGQFAHDEKGTHALEIDAPNSDEYSYRSELPNIEPDSQIIQIHLSGRYYGEGYERGSFYVYKSIAEWLEIRIPSCEIYYGGDSGGQFVLFNSKIRQEAFEYFATHGHDPYHSYFDRDNNPNKPLVCGFCANRKMIQYGWGGKDGAFSCSGCGQQVALQNGKYIPFEGEWFNWREAQKKETV